MAAEKYTDAEIVALLEDGRMAETDLTAAIRIANRHSNRLVEWWREEDGTWQGPATGHPDDCWTRPVIETFKKVRITIPRPPKRRALRAEDVRGYIFQGRTYPLWVEEPQPPLVITTEGKE